METISDLKRLGYSLYITCGACRANRVTLDPKEAFERYGPFVLLKDTQRISRCSKCGSRSQVKVDWGMPG